MRLGLFMMPMHPQERDPAVTLQEDREMIILVDRLGFHDAFVGEHITDACENITNSFIFLASVIAQTKTIKLATGTSCDLPRLSRPKERNSKVPGRTCASPASRASGSRERGSNSNGS